MTANDTADDLVLAFKAFDKVISVLLFDFQRMVMVI